MSAACQEIARPPEMLFSFSTPIAARVPARRMNKKAQSPPAAALKLSAALRHPVRQWMVEVNCYMGIKCCEANSIWTDMRPVGLT